MKANYWQRGETLDYKNETSEVIEANTVLKIGSRIGIAGTSMKPGELGAIHVMGVFEMPKTNPAEVIEVGTDVYFDGTGITKTSSGSTVKAGYCAQSTGATNDMILVKLLG